MLENAETVFSDMEQKIVKSLMLKVAYLQYGKDELLVHGTTCIATVCQGGVVIAADGRATTDKIEAEDFEKVFNLDDYSAIAMAGSAGLCQQIASLLKAKFGHQWNLSEGKYIPPKTRLNSVANIIRNVSAPVINAGMGVSPILAIYDNDRHDSGGRVFAVFADGTIMPEAPFKAIGSGGRDAKNCLDMTIGFMLSSKPEEVSSDFLRNNLSVEDAKKFIVYALMTANRHDQSTGSRTNMRVISEAGIENIHTQEISEIIARIKKGGLR